MRTTHTLPTLAICAFLFAPMAAAQGGRWYRTPIGPDQSYRDITRIINNCEDRTDDFRGSLRRALNNSPFDNSRREQVLRARADQLERALDRTGDSWNRDRDPERTRYYVREALDAGREINAAMRYLRLDYEVERDWAAIRAQLNALGRAFRVGELR